MNNQRSVKSLTKKAGDGSLMAAYTLFEYYSNGVYVEKDADKAEYYSQLIRTQASNLKLRVLAISLDSFRGFKALKVAFQNGKLSSNPIVFTGINGVGKSAILDAIVYGLGWFTQRMINPRNTYLTINEQDIYRSKSEKSDSASITLQLQINSSDIFTVELLKSRGDSNLNMKGNYDELNALVGIYRHINEKCPEVGLPLVAFYGVNRASEVTSKDIDQNDEIKSNSRQNKIDGYKRSVSGSAHFSSFFRWLKDAQDVQNNRISKLYERKEIKLLKQFVDSKKYELSSADISAAFADLHEKLKNLTDNTGDEKNLYDRNIKVISQAIEGFLSGFRNFRIQYEPALDLLLDKNEVTLSVLQLSQGEKSLLALVADIARRLVLLNPSADNPLSGDGVVIIDEIDLHLHPSWQQSIIPKLTSIFPNLQFLITTHSPQVLSTVTKECIRVLGKSVDGKDVAAVPKAFSYGMPSNDVMETIMHVNPQPPVPEEPKLNELTSLVDQGLYDSERALYLINELKSLLNESHPQLEKIERSIRRQKALKK